MSVLKTNTLLLSLNQFQAKKAFRNLVLKDINFEILDPKELGKEWDEIHYLNSTTVQNPDQKEKLDLLKDVLKDQEKTGFVNSFIDQRFTSSGSDIQAAMQKESYILEIAKNLRDLKKTKDNYSQIDFFLIKNNNKNLLFSKEIESFKKEFERYLSSISKGDKSFFETSLALHKNIGDWQAISFSIEDGERIGDLLKEFIKERYQDTQDAHFFDAEQISKHLADKVENLTSKLEKKEIDVNNIPEDLYIQFACLHGSYELEDSLDKKISHIFSLEQNSKSNFAFLSFRESDSIEVIEILDENDINYQETQWNKEIVDWRSKGGLKAFQDVSQSIGTISSKEADPTPVLAIFFMILFAFCLNDVIYGLIIAAFTGFFLFTKPLKEGFKGIFTIMFYSSLVAMLLGMLTNSWAGDLFNSNLAKRLMGLDPATVTDTPINSLLKNFQLIDVLNADAAVPINQIFAGISPILIMLILAIIIGFIHQVLAYILRTVTNIKKGNMNIAFGQLAWMFFLFASILYLLLTSNDPSMSTIAKVILGVSILGLLLLNQANTVGGKILGFLFGPRGIYGIAQFGANLISYTRIIAIGLTGGVIASIINLLAGIVFESMNPIIGFIFALIILVIGHVFNFVLSVFGAYINPIRLTYVEFMPNFFEGDARQLKSEKLNLSYLKLENRNN